MVKITRPAGVYQSLGEEQGAWFGLGLGLDGGHHRSRGETASLSAESDRPEPLSGQRWVKQTMTWASVPVDAANISSSAG